MSAGFPEPFKPSAPPLAPSADTEIGLAPPPAYSAAVAPVFSGGAAGRREGS
jgi:hypothetical protein